MLYHVLVGIMFLTVTDIDCDDPRLRKAMNLYIIFLWPIYLIQIIIALIKQRKEK